MKFSRSTPEDTLGRDVMEYLGRVAEENKAKRRPKPRHRLNTLTDVNQPMTWKIRGTESDNTPAPKTSSMKEPNLRVSPLLSKLAAAEEGVDFQYDANGYRIPANPPLSKSIQDWNDAWGSPIVSSLGLATIPAVGVWGLHKWLNPDDGKEKAILSDVDNMIDEDKKAGRKVRDKDYYTRKAIDAQKRRRMLYTLGAYGLSAALLHLQHYNPSDPASLYRYPNTIHKKASMLGPMPAVPFGDVQTAIQTNPFLAPSIKSSAMNALNFNPAPMMTSTDLVNNAIMSGESAKTGLPIGRIMASAVVDGMAGYGLGNLLGVSRPDRLGILTGVGSALFNALS